MVPGTSSSTVNFGLLDQKAGAETIWIGSGFGASLCQTAIWTGNFFREAAGKRACDHISSGKRPDRGQCLLSGWTDGCPDPKAYAWSGGGTTVYLACGSTNLRKSYNGLAAIIKLKFHLDPYSRCMFAFCNRRRTSIKILQWDGSGFWILMKRLDRNSFRWPDTPDELKKVTLKEIHWLCDGLSLDPKGAFEEHHPKITV